MIINFDSYFVGLKGMEREPIICMLQILATEKLHAFLYGHNTSYVTCHFNKLTTFPFCGMNLCGMNLYKNATRKIEIGAQL